MTAKSSHCRFTFAQQRYAIENPNGFTGYSRDGWGFTASAGPGPTVRVVEGVRREFFGYNARGAPFGPDDGTISPWAVVASLPFAPDVVCATIRHAIARLAPNRQHRGGFDASFNSTFVEEDKAKQWVSPWRFGPNEGPIVLMIENYLSEFVWSIFMRCPYVVTGLRSAGFRAVGRPCSQH